ncbi:MAG: AAA family ATPase [Alphaproteobacteria bacterium]|nr:AAA family ATPase [Alphaproteobacteria bacterium]
MININKNLFLQRKNNVIAITSGVGSMGKTWLAVTLSHALNMLQQSVLLFDADNGLLNVSAQIEQKAPFSLNDVVSSTATLNQAIISVNRRKFDVISGDTGGNILESTPVGRLQILRDDVMCLACDYDYLLLDLPASEKIAQNILPPESNLILVCTKEPSNLVSTYKFLQTAAVSERYKNMQIIVNYAQSYEEGLQTYNILRRACEEYITQTPLLLGVVRRDTRVRDAIRNRFLLLNRYPNSEAAADIMQIARKILPKGEK